LSCQNRQIDRHLAGTYRQSVIVLVRQTALFVSCWLAVLSTVTCSMFVL